MKNERWFISYRTVKKDFVFNTECYEYDSVVSDVTPARWVMLQKNETHILYAESISLALASELIHSGIGVRANYCREDGD